MRYFNNRRLVWAWTYLLAKVIAKSSKSVQKEMYASMKRLNVRPWFGKIKSTKIISDKPVKALTKIKIDDNLLKHH